MHPSRILGAIIGVAALVCIFGLPFSTAASATNNPESLFSNFQFFVNNIAGAQASGSNSVVLFAYLYQLGFILIFAAAVVGVFPLGAGVLGMIGMGFLTLGPFEVFNGWTFSDNGFSSGFYALWILFIFLIVLALWGWRAKPNPRENVLATEMRENTASMPAPGPAPAAGGPAPQGSGAMKPCPICGAMNAQTAVVCTKCAAPLDPY